MNWHPLWVVAPSVKDAAVAVAAGLASLGIDETSERRHETLLESILRYGLVLLTGTEDPRSVRKAWEHATDDALAGCGISARRTRDRMVMLSETFVFCDNRWDRSAKGYPRSIDLATLARPRGQFVTVTELADILAIPSAGADHIQLVDRYFMSKPNQAKSFNYFMEGVFGRVPQRNAKFEIICARPEPNRGVETPEIISIFNRIAGVHPSIRIAEKKAFRMHDRGIKFSWCNGKRYRAFAIGQGPASMSDERRVVLHELSGTAFDSMWKDASRLVCPSP